jgi:hypothetical protein
MCLQDRLYFRGTKFQRQVLGIERSVNKRIDDKIAEMTTVLDAQHRRIMGVVERQTSQLRTELHILTKRVERVEKLYRKLERRQDELLDDIYCSEMFRERPQRTQTAQAQLRGDSTEDFAMN